MTFVDTNFFLRFLLKDNNSQFVKARILFEKGAKGEIRLFTSVVVFFEIYWVLSSFYGKNKKEVAQYLQDILSLAFIEFENISILEKSAEYFKDTNLDLEDAYNIAYAKEKGAISFQTFDIKLRKHY